MNASDKMRAELSSMKAEVKRLRKTLQRLTPGLAILLKRRGFSIYKQEPSGDLLAPAKKFRSGYYRMLHKYSFRLLLRDVIKHQDGFVTEQVARYATPGVTKKYLDYLVSIKLLKKTAEGYRLGTGPITSFGTTLEWYVAEALRREFAAEAVWGVKFRRTNVGGDYDVIAKLEGTLVYAEVKSSPPKQIYDTEIAAFLDRVDDLSPELAVFLMDTELRMKDKIVPLFEQELAKRYTEPPAVERMERELFSIRNRIFIINAKEDIVQNIQKAISGYYKKGEV
jgi:hypothetical protein